MDEISRRFYQFMCDNIVGSEKVVTYRRQFFHVLDDVFNATLSTYNCQFISSGSKAEGLDLPGSDLDIMILAKKYLAYESEEIGANFSPLDNIRIERFSLFIITDYSQPGFVLLQPRDETAWDKKFLHSNEIGTFISNKVFKQTPKGVSVHGPCLSDFFGTMDTAFCLEFKKWPSVASHWISRHRSSGWPCDSLVSEIITQKVLLVPIGSKSDSQTDNPLEWRISFSIPEKSLIHSWTHSQILCYTLLKILLKEVIQRNIGIEKLLCSYFMKTTIFWLSEELEPSVWTPNNVLRCFKSCLKRLTYWMTYKYLPNYFIPEHNMIDRNIAGQFRHFLLGFLNLFHDHGWKCLVLTDSFKEFCFSLREQHIEDAKITTRYTDFEKAIFPLLNTLLYTNQIFELDIFTSLEKCYFQARNNKMPKRLRSLYCLLSSCMVHELAELSISESCQTDNKQRPNQQKYWNNKHLYSKAKQLFSHCLLEANSGCMSGWYLLAVYFFYCKQYHKTLTILEYANNVCSLNQLVVTVHVHTRITDMKDNESRSSSFLRRVKFKTAWDLVLLFWKSVNSYYTDKLINLYPSSSRIYCPSKVFLHYLRFACYHRLHDINRRQQSLKDLAVTVENETLKQGPVLRLASYMYLIEAFKFTGDNQKADDYFSTLCNFIISSELLPLFEYKILSIKVP